MSYSLISSRIHSLRMGLFSNLHSDYMINIYKFLAWCSWISSLFLASIINQIRIRRWLGSQQRSYITEKFYRPEKGIQCYNFYFILIEKVSLYSRIIMHIKLCIPNFVWFNIYLVCLRYCHMMLRIFNWYDEWMPRKVTFLKKKLMLQSRSKQQ